MHSNQSAQTYPSVFRTLACLCMSCILWPLSAQESIYNGEQPEIQNIWYRIADVTPKLRAVEAAELSPDGLLAVSGSKFGYKVMLWSVLDGSLVWENRHESEVECVVFSPDGHRIASGGEDFFVRIWDVATGAQLKSWEHPSGLDGITWSHDGQIIATGAEDGTAFFWDAETYEMLWKISVGSTINSLHFTKDDKQILLGGNYQNPDPENPGEIIYTGYAKLVDLDARSIIREYGTHDASVKSVRISPDEKMIATASFDRHAKIFDFESAEEMASFEESRRIEAVAFSGDSQYLLTGGHHKRITFYRLRDMQKVLEYPTPKCEYIDISHDGRLMLTAHEDSGLLGLHMFLSNLQHDFTRYHKTADAQLNNRDLKGN